jgi:prepilin peptidase CpaA
MKITPLFFLTLLVTVSAVIDLKTQRIPNVLVLSGLIFGFLYNLLSFGLEGILFGFLGLFTGLAIFIVPYLMGGMGAGDAKLMGSIGAIIGAKGVVNAFIPIAIAGGIYALALLISRNEGKSWYSKAHMGAIELIYSRNFPTRSENSSAKAPKLCYGVAIALGTYVYVFLQFMGFEFI